MQCLPVKKKKKKKNIYSNPKITKKHVVMQSLPGSQCFFVIGKPQALSTIGIWVTISLNVFFFFL